MEENNLYTQMQLDALKEVSNIGVGNAATALSSMLNRKIDMTVPSVNITLLNDLLFKIGEEEVYGLVVRVLGDIGGIILLSMEKEAAVNIASLLTFTDNSVITEIGISALCEIGNIVSGSYMNAISKFTGLTIIPTVPAMANDTLSSILSTAFIESEQYDENILEIETVFLDSSKNNLGAHFYYVPKPGSLEKILKTIGMN